MGVTGKRNMGVTMGGVGVGMVLQKASGARSE